MLTTLPAVSPTFTLIIKSLRPGASKLARCAREFSEMKKLFVISSILSLALITSACGAAMNPPIIKSNPHPKMRYEITMTIDGAQGPFDGMETIAQYDISNDHCVPLTPISGARLSPDKTIPIHMTKVGDNSYRGEIFTDQLVDEDYYGKGVCHWKLTAFSGYLRVKKSTVTTGIQGEEVVAQATAKRFFSNQNFTDAKLSGVDIGDADRSAYKDPSNTFSVTFTAKENFQ
jgi:hypothetical protein